ncbi:MAG: DNA-binding response regulator [Bacteroidetes bacterium HGW-Bacteroidetes-17]|jgi:DNA-binding NarL/FixJ family response regulator|nr:MAG: DNA-binding response regulator [Bacteroidetes bacterium HGW-Bacteroidetes-17]
MIKLALAEDNHFLAQSIEEKISFFDDIKYKFRAINGVHLLKLLESDHNLDIILMDIEMPEMNGITATEAVKKLYPHIKIIMLTVFDDEERIFKAIIAGADGYLLKDEKSDNIKKGIIEIMDGGAPMSPTIAIKALSLLRNPREINEITSPQTKMTSRENEVLMQLSHGLNYNEIGANLNISSGTVRKHIENIYRKLHVHNKIEAVNYAKKNRLIK